MLAGAVASATVFRWPEWTQAILGVFVSPRRCFEIVRDSAPWVGLLVLLSASSVALTFLMAPYMLQAATVSLPEGASLAQRQQLADVVHLGNFARFALAPISVALRWLVGGLLIWLLVLASGGEARYSRAFSLAAHASLIPHVFSWVVLGVLSRRGAVAIQRASDLQPALGLDRLLSSDHAALRALLGSVNPFSVWYLILLALGVSLVFAGPKIRSLFVATTYWGALVGLQALLVGIADAVSPR